MLKLFKRNEIDMLHGPLYGKLIIFSIPLALTAFLQQLFNAADVMVLGQFVSKEAMAAVGNNTSIIGLLINMFFGLSLGANVVIARYIGAGQHDWVRTAVHTAMAVGMVSGVLVCVFGLLMTDELLNMMEVPTEVYDMSATYLRIYMLVLPFTSLFNFEAAICRSKGDANTPLIALGIGSIINILLNLLFTASLDMGIAGVAWATVIAYASSAFYMLWILLGDEGIIRVIPQEIKINKNCLVDMAKIGLPASIQGMVFCLSNIIIQHAINSLGADVMAASAAAFTIEINMFCIVSATSQAVTTFVSQNNGARNLPRCQEVLRKAMIICHSSLIVSGAAAIFFGPYILSFFNDDPIVIEYGMIRVVYVIALEVVNATGELLSGSLRGFGCSLPPAMATLVGICGVRISWVYWVFPMKPDFPTIMLVYPVSWIVATIAIVIIYKIYFKEIKKTFPTV